MTLAQRSTLEGYFAALERADWGALGELCTEDVVYHVPGKDPRLSRKVIGRAAFVAMAEEMFQTFRAPQFAISEVIPLPAGALVRYRSSWEVSPVGRTVADSAIAFVLRDGRIAQIGIRIDLVRIGALASGAA